MIETNKIYQGDALEVLKTFTDESINCVMTSPPYWALRDYGNEKQLGLEKTFDEYINKLCDIFDEVKRVLRKDGTCWVNIGDTYNSHSTGKGEVGGIEGKRKNKGDNKANTKKQFNLIPDKCLVMIPFRFAIEMVNRGWILRNTIIWYKPNCMPSSVKDRFTTDFEYLFFFVKSKKYYFETQYEPIAEISMKDKRKDKGRFEYNGKRRKFKEVTLSKVPYAIQPRDKEFALVPQSEMMGINSYGRNKRAVWRITTKPFKESHFAVFPEELCETPLKAGCPENGIVLDPFMGSGTTGLSALKQNKRFIGIELNPEYIKIAEARIKPHLSQTKLNKEAVSIPPNPKGIGYP